MNKKVVTISAGVTVLFVTFVIFGIILLTRGPNSSEEASTNTGDVLLSTDNSTSYSFINWHVESAVGGVLASILTLGAIYTILKKLKAWWLRRFPVTTPTLSPSTTIPPPPLHLSAPDQPINPHHLLIQDLPPAYRNIAPRRRHRLSVNPHIQTVRYIPNPSRITLPNSASPPDFDMERLNAQIRQVLAVDREEDSEDEETTYEMEQQHASINQANLDID